MLFAAATVVLALALIEASARLYYAVRNHTALAVSLHAYWIDDPAAGYVLKPGYAAGGIRINSLGFRGPEISPDRTNGILRMAALGDSTTSGHVRKSAPTRMRSRRFSGPATRRSSTPESRAIGATGRWSIWSAMCSRFIRTWWRCSLA